MAARIALALAALLLLAGLFSPEIADSDFWWHLATGRYIAGRHALPVPDPFAFTTASARDAYPGESVTRRFNLTHEWLAQAAFYLVYRAAGLGGVVLFRAALLTAFCALAGIVVYRRTGGVYRALAATLAAASVAVDFAVDRPYLFTFLFLALTVLILDARRRLWLLPPLFVLWANCHGGFILGWIAVAAYAVDWLARRADRRALAPCAAAVLASGLNPNGFRVLPVLLDYRRSFLQSKLLEWTPPALWPPPWFAILMLAAALMLLRSRRCARLADWLLLAAFSAAALTAGRNIVLIGWFAPIAIASYIPWTRPLPRAAGFAVAALLLTALAAGIVSGRFFQLRMAEWRYPAGAARFLRVHNIAGPIFNTYEYGGYLIWKLWPQNRVFIDGRALSESVFRDYARILYDREQGRALLDPYRVDTIVMNGFQYTLGLVYELALHTDWKLVYSDPQAMIFMRAPPPGVAPLDPRLVYDHLEAECALHIDREPAYPRCARALGQIFSKSGELTRARQWLAVYLAHPHAADPEAEAAYAQLVTLGK